MKTMNIYGSFAALCAAAMFCAVSCDEPAPVPEVTPEFPSLVENMAVVPGETLTLTFAPNMDWEATVPEDTMDFFWLLDGSFQYSKLSGKASESPVTVTVGVSDKVDFVNRTTTVKLTMGGETRVIAKYMRPAEGKSVQLYACQVDEEGAWIFDEEGNYAYGETEPQEIRLVYTGSDFRIPVRVSSNLEYSVELPEWARADIPEIRTGQHDFNITGVPSKYPLDEEAGKLVFKHEGEVVKEYVIKTPGCRDIMTYGVDMVTSVDFADNGLYKTTVGFLEAPVTAWISGTSLATVKAVELKNGKYDVSSSKSPSWLSIDVEDYSAVSTTDVIRRRNVEISAKELGTAEERAAVVFFLPEDTKDLASLFTEDAASVKEEYAESVIYVTQKKYGYLTIADEAAFAEGKGTMMESADESLKTLFGRTSYAYEMTYKDQWASDNGRLLFLEEYASFKVYNKILNENADDNFFLSFNEERVCIEMTGDVADMGYVVFYDGAGKVLATVKCIYEPATGGIEYEEDQIRDASMYFTDPAAAAEAGVQLEEIWAGPTFNDCEDAVNDGATLLRLTCAENTKVTLNLPTDAHMIAAYPKNSFTLDGVDLSAGAAYLSGMDTVTISYVKAPETFLRTPSVAVYNKSNKAVLVVYCLVAE